MTNIFNKIHHVANGTLVGNWYEEQCLRDKTREGRTIPARHIPKKAMDFDTVISVDPKSKDNTFDRIAGSRPNLEFQTTNSTYGDFSQPENKYKKIGIKERIYNDFFNCYVGKVNEAQSSNGNQDDGTLARLEYEKKLSEARESLRRKIIAACFSKGWLGYRKFKLFLKALSKKHDMFIHKDDIKYFFVNFGICLEERELEFIYAYFQNSKNEINYEELLNSFIMITEERMHLIHLFLEQLRGNNAMVKDVLINLLKPGMHPSVHSYKKTEKEIIMEYSTAWENRTVITDEDFIQLFCEINIIVQDDRDFFGVLLSCGYIHQQD